MRSLLKGHITGSAWIVNQSGTQTVLVHHKKLDRWLQPGGHADGNTDIFEVARNEAVEETGIKNLFSSREIFDVDVHLIPAVNDIPNHYHYDIRFLFTAKDNAPLIVSDESHDVHWIAAEKISEYAVGEESILRMKEKWLSARQKGEERIQ
jgi:8-oxo-dGTP pyrophosphatase MutT (NUDIX family)